MTQKIMVNFCIIIAVGLGLYLLRGERWTKIEPGNAIWTIIIAASAAAPIAYRWRARDNARQQRARNQGKKAR